MKKELSLLLNQTLAFAGKIPDQKNDIEQINMSTVDDDSFVCLNNENLATVIYNSIVDYSFNEFELSGSDFQDLLAVALMQKIKYKEWQAVTTKISYGFYGEVLLHSVLYHFYKTKQVISRGVFYDPLEDSETKGYDSYHFIEADTGRIELWFGEVKFRQSFHNCLDDAIKNLDKVITDDYFSRNLIAIKQRKNDLATENSKVIDLITSWRDKPQIRLIDEIKKHDLKLVYPILLVYQDKDPTSIEETKRAVSHINRKYSALEHQLSIDLELFFIFIPLSEVKAIKERVIEWIDSKKPLL